MNFQPDEYLKKLLEGNMFDDYTEKGIPTQGDDDFKKELVKMQIEQSLETYRSQFSLLIQIVTTFILADVTVIGFAISTNISGIIFIGAIFPFLIIFIGEITSRLMKPVVFTAVSLESKYGGKKDFWLFSSFMRYYASERYIKAISSISEIADDAERLRQFYFLPHISIIGSSSTLYRSLMMISAGHIIVPFMLHFIFDWRLF